MPKFKTEKFFFYDQQERQDSDVLTFSIDVNISAKGVFYTNLKPEIVEKFEAVGIDTCIAESRNKSGYYEANTYGDLKAIIIKLGEQYVSKEIISQTLKIEYSIETQCNYAFENGEVFPNGYYIENGETGDYWRNGTIKDTFSSPSVYGFQIYAQPFNEVVYKYPSGKTFKKKLYHPNDLSGLGENGKWLRAIIRQRKPVGGILREIEYSEDIAGFFRSLFEWLFRLNERIKNMVEPDLIREMAQNKQLFLGTGKK